VRAIFCAMAMLVNFRFVIITELKGSNLQKRKDKQN